ncbi:MAG: Cif family virulence factor [Armatimonadota bacterium]
MKKTSWVILAVIIALILFLIYQNVSKNNALSGELQISMLANDAKSAVEQKDVRRTMSYISDAYSDSNGMSRASLRAMVIRAYKDFDRYSIVFNKADITVTGDTAKVELDVRVSARNQYQYIEVFSGPVTLFLQKVPARQWLIFSTSKWLVSGTSGLPSMTME